MNDCGRWLSRLATVLLLLTLLAGWSGAGLAKDGQDDGSGADSTAVAGSGNHDGATGDGEHDGGGNDGSGTSTDAGPGNGDGADDGGGASDGSGGAYDSGGGSNDWNGSGDATGEGDGNGSGDGRGVNQTGDDGSGGNGSDGDSNSDVLEIVGGNQPEDVPVVDSDGNATTDGFRAGQSIVRLRHTASIEAVNARHGTTTLATIPVRHLFLLQLPTDRPEAESERQLEGDPDVAWAELNYANRAPEGRPGYFFVSGAPSSRPGPSYAADLLGLPQARRCATGAGITVAVLDTGIDVTHPALAGHLSPDAWNALTGGSDVADVGSGRDDGNGLVDKMVGHGTHVAGIVLQTAPDSTILPIRVLDSNGVGDAFFLAAGIFYAIDHGARVINLSLSSTFDARVVRDAVAVAEKAGVIVVAAAGNANRSHPREFPAADRGAFGVAATDSRDHKSDFSNYGIGLSLSAPGTDIVSAIPGGGYAAWSGTSMAAPFVAGAVADLLSEHPDWTAQDVKARMAGTSVGLDALNPSFAGELGAGRLDVNAAVACAG
jgi:subtilisin family serine protease